LGASFARQDDPSPPGRLPALLVAGTRLVWQADPRGLVLVALLQLLQGVGVLGALLAVRAALDTLLSADSVAAALLPVVVLVALLAASGVIGAVVAERDQLLSEVVGLRLQGRVLAVAAALDYVAFETPALHDRLERARLSARTGPLQLVQGLVGLAGALVGLAGATSALLALHPLLLPVAALSAAPLALAGSRSGRLLSEFVFSTTPVERERDYLAQLLTSRDAAKEVRVLGLSDHLRARWQHLATRRLEKLRTVVRGQLRLGVLGSLASSLLLGGAVATLAALIASGRLTPAEGGAAGAALLVLAQRLQGMGMALSLLLEAAPFVRDLDEFLSLPVSPPPLEAAPPPLRHRIAVRDVSFTYPGQDVPALRGVSFEIGRGQVVALVGENGSGKTTLAKLLCGLHTPTSGRITWDDVDLATVGTDGLRDQIAVLFQDFQRYLLPASENIALGRVSRRTDSAAVRSAALRAGAHDFLARLPAGYDTVLGPEFEGGSDLSIGQWQRVALARAFFRDAPLLILDEPTAALDPRAERALFDAVRELYRDRTVLLISHRFSSVRDADVIVVLRSGRVAECGSHDNLLRHGGHYAELYRLQAAAYG
jgi:ATP-binding cassette subfamily B protein